MELKRVVVTGLGAITPIGNTVSEFWDGVVGGKSGAGPITRFDTEKFKVKFACEVKGFDPSLYIDPKDARKMDLFTQYSISVAAQAIDDAHLDTSKLNLDKVGVIFGVGIGGIITFEQEMTNYALNKEMGPRFNPFFIPKMISDIAPGMISIRYGFRGVNFTTTSACASSTNALVDAFNYIRLGKADIILAGGAEAAVCEAGIGGFSSMHALSTRNDSPQTASRPYSKSRDGFVLGEGAGCLVLEEYEHAKARGAKILAEVVGYGFSSNGLNISQPSPEGCRISIYRALDDAKLKSKDVDYINAHATSTPQGDAAEAMALDSIFTEHKTPISSTKSMTGHECWMAGASEIVYSVLMMKNDFIAPNINFENPDEYSQNLNIISSTQSKKLDVILSNSFGFGGTNSTLIIKKI